MQGSQGFSTGDYAHTVAIQSDLQARLADILARKDLALASIENLIDRAEAPFSGEGVRSLIRGLLSRFQRDGRKSEASPTGGADWEALLRRIHAAGRQGSIENYTEHLFTVSVSDDSL